MQRLSVVALAALVATVALVPTALAHHRCSHGQLAAVAVAKGMTSGDTDRYVFDMDAGDNLHLEYVPGDLGAFLTMFLEDCGGGTVYGENVVCCLWTAPADGSYAIRIVHDGGFPTFYNLNAQVVPTG